MKEKCEDCPVKQTISGPGIMSVKSEDLIKCCRVKRQIAAANKYFGGRSIDQTGQKT